MGKGQAQEVRRAAERANSERKTGQLYAHHVTQRGSRRQQTFSCDEDYAAYLAPMGERSGNGGKEYGVTRLPRSNPS